jgi:uroporphyrinogen III methyltransferase/synthase
MEPRRGVVSFVGLGPGDTRLWAERTTQRLAEADAIVDDEQASVARLVELARQGQRVVRTVAGDPLESARCVAEALQVASAGVEIELVPAVGASAAAGAFAGVVARAVLTPAVEVGSVVAGMPGDAPVTLVTSPSLPSQHVEVTTAARAPELARALGSTRVLVAFGAPDDALRWFERRPLFGKRVLITRAREQAGRAAALLRDEGADVVIVPTIEIEPPGDPAPLARALRDLRAGAYGWVAFTSANGVEQTWKALVASGADARAFGSVRLAAIGPATARALEAHGLRADLVAKEFRGESLADEMLGALRASGGTPRVLLARAAKAREVVPEALRAAGYGVDVVAAYETHAPPRETVERLAREIERGKIDAVTFTSSSTVDNFCDLLGPRAVELLGGLRVAAIGPVTRDTAVGRGVRVDVVASEYTVPGLVQALVKSYA